MTPDDGPFGPSWVAAACGGAVIAARRARWGFRHETWLVDLDHGRRVVVQRRADGFDSPASDARQMRERVRSAGIPVPEPIAMHRIGDDAVIVLPFVEGIVAAELLATDAGAAAAGRACGEVAAGLAATDPAGLRLPDTWADGPALRAVVARWVAALDPGPAGDMRERVSRTAERAARELEAAGPRFAHGDLAPVNVLVRDGRPATVLDLDRARLAHPGYDAAWFSWTITFHHPGVAATAWSAFARASGAGGRPVEDVAWMWPLLLLERAAEAQDDAERRLWSDRLVRTLAG